MKKMMILFWSFFFVLIAFLSFLGHVDLLISQGSDSLTQIFRVSIINQIVSYLIGAGFFSCFLISKKKWKKKFLLLFMMVFIINANILLVFDGKHNKVKSLIGPITVSQIQTGFEDYPQLLFTKKTFHVVVQNKKMEKGIILIGITPICIDWKGVFEKKDIVPVKKE